MQIQTHDADLYVDNSLMRVYVASPKPEGKYPGILLYSEIFQLTGPIIRSANRLAGYGFVVAAPEIYHRHEPIGTVIAYDDLGSNARDDGRWPSAPLSVRMTPTRKRRSITSRPIRKSHGQLGTSRASASADIFVRCALLDPRVKASVCCYPTGVHNGKLGKDADAGTRCAASNELRRGTPRRLRKRLIPTSPLKRRQIVAEALKKSNVRHKNPERCLESTHSCGMEGA